MADAAKCYNQYIWQCKWDTIRSRTVWFTHTLASDKINWFNAHFTFADYVLLLVVKVICWISYPMFMFDDWHRHQDSFFMWVTCIGSKYIFDLTIYFSLFCWMCSQWLPLQWYCMEQLIRWLTSSVSPHGYSTAVLWSLWLWCVIRNQIIHGHTRYAHFWSSIKRSLKPHLHIERVWLWLVHMHMCLGCLMIFNVLSTDFQRESYYKNYDRNGRIVLNEDFVFDARHNLTHTGCTRAM